MNLNRYDIIKRPISTEKTTLQKEMLNQVTFEVDKRANRLEIEKHVEAIFNVRVASESLPPLNKSI